MKTIYRKTFGVAIITVMLFFGVTNAYSAEIYIPHVKGAGGDIIMIPILVNSAPNTVEAFGGKIVYDISSLTFKGTSVEGTLVENFAFANANASGDKIIFGGFDSAGFGAEANGTLMNLNFEVNSPCRSSSLALQELVDDISGWTKESGNFSCDDAGVCFDNPDCSTGLYCDKPQGNCDGAGVCSAKPEICIDLYLPVCGCDGITYGNDCEAAASGVSVAYLGKCGSVCVPGVDTQPCDTGLLGVCTAGTRTCNQAGTDWNECIQDNQPSPEACPPDGLDNDCDGQTDEELDNCNDCTLAPDSVVVSPNGNFTIPIRINNAPNQVDSLGFDVTYDSTVMTFTGYTPGDLTENFDFFNTNLTTGGKIRVGGFETGGDVIHVGATGVVVNLNFTIGMCQAEQCFEIIISGLVDDIGNWSACRAEVCFQDCTPEICDGIDNDNDGEIDENGEILCDDSNPCTKDSCDLAIGCINAPDPMNGSYCVGNGECNPAECSDGKCEDLIFVRPYCDDGNFCTYDTCAYDQDAPYGIRCMNSTDMMNGTLCDDKDTCTENDVCSEGVCGGEIGESCNQPPDCSNAMPSISEIWPPNHKMVDVGIEGITDPDGDTVTVTITDITQDEPVNGNGDSNTFPDGDVPGIAQVRAERSGQGDGRVYEISFVAEDGRGGECNGSVQVCVPHNKKDGCIDNGQDYFSVDWYEFKVTIDLDSDPIEICFTPDRELTTDPIVTVALTKGNGTMNPDSGSTVSPVDDSCTNLPTYCVEYTPTDNDKEVEIWIEEDTPVIPGYLAFEVASFEIDPHNDIASSFCIFNIVGRSGSLKGEQCDNDDVVFAAEADALYLNGAKDDNDDPLFDDFNCIPVKIVDVDSDSIPAIPNINITGISDISLPDGVKIADGQTVMVTLNFVLPNGWDQQEFLDNLQVLYFDEETGSWSPDGISNVEIDWDARTIAFDTTHLTKFAASSKQTAGEGGGGGEDSGSQATSGGGCSVTSHNMSGGSAMANTLIMFLPLIVFGISRRRRLMNS